MTDDAEKQRTYERSDNTLVECGIPGCGATEQKVCRDNNGNLIPVCMEHWEDGSFTDVEYDGF